MTGTLVRLHRITGRLIVETGLRIGASADTMEISGLDNPILRNAATGEPYIPGSSLKGRMRSLAEWFYGELPTDGEVIKPRLDSRTARVFGIPANDRELRGPTRLIVRDAPLSDTSRKAFLAGRPLTEVKSENSINRLTAMANPRPMERVVPGTSFDVELVYRVFDLEGDVGAADAERLEVVMTALALVEADALGGGGSRGNGKVRFALAIDGQPLTLPQLCFPSAARGA
jgi:CRISPR-associated protein Csm3